MSQWEYSAWALPRGIEPDFAAGRQSIAGLSEAALEPARQAGLEEWKWRPGRLPVRKGRPGSLDRARAVLVDALRYVQAAWAGEFEVERRQTRSRDILIIGWTDGGDAPPLLYSLELLHQTGVLAHTGIRLTRAPVRKSEPGPDFGDVPATIWNWIKVLDESAARRITELLGADVLAQRTEGRWVVWYIGTTDGRPISGARISLLEKLTDVPAPTILVYCFLTKQGSSVPLFWKAPPSSRMLSSRVTPEVAAKGVGIRKRGQDRVGA